MQTIKGHNNIEYQQLENGTCYHKETSQEVIDVLENAIFYHKRIRIYYGKNGKCWNEENDTIGYIGRSCGIIKIPLLIKNSRSYGGGGLLDHCIVKIVNISTKKIEYIHKKFSQSLFEAEGKAVYQDGKDFAPNCKNVLQAERLAQFMNGERNSK